MTQLINVPTVGGTHRHPTLPFNAQETINLFPERGQNNSKSPAILRRTPGTKLALTLTGSGAVRGSYTTSQLRAFAVCYNNVVEITVSAGSLVETIIGKINTTFGPVDFTDNGGELGIADGNSIWKIDLATSVLSQVTSVNAPDSTPVLEFIDSYVFGFDPASNAIGSFRHSNVNDITTWDAVDVYTAEASPDKIVSIKAFNSKLWVFGSKSYQVFYNFGGDNSSPSNPTWAYYQGSFKSIGCAATYSVSVIRDRIFWLGSSKDGKNIIWMASGFEPVRISNRAIESIIDDMSVTDDAISFTYEYKGHHFYVLTFQAGNKTLVYDLEEGEWHTWAYRNTITGVQGRHRAVTQFQFNNTSYVGDYVNGNIYELDDKTYTDNGDPIVWERIFTHFEAQKRRVSWLSIQIGFLVGTANLTGDGSDPFAQIRWSKDGGNDFGNWHDMSLGVRGRYDVRVIKRLLGLFRTATFHVRGSDPIPMSIQDDSVAEIDVGDY